MLVVIDHHHCLTELSESYWGRRAPAKRKDCAAWAEKAMEEVPPCLHYIIPGLVLSPEAIQCFPDSGRNRAAEAPCTADCEKYLHRAYITSQTPITRKSLNLVIFRVAVPRLISVGVTVRPGPEQPINLVVLPTEKDFPK